MSDRIAHARCRVSEHPGERARVLLSLLAVDVLYSDGDAAEAATLAEQALADGTLIRDEVMTDMPFASPALSSSARPAGSTPLVVRPTAR